MEDVDFAIATVSSKGQVVIPANLRKSFRKGQKLLLIRQGKRIIMRQMEDLKVAQDLEFAKRTDAALQRYEKRPEEFKTLPAKEFLKELKKW